MREQEAIEREQARERAAAEADLRPAKRLLLEELDTLALHRAMLAAAGRHPTAFGPGSTAMVFRTDAWEADKRTLARGLSDSEWNTLSTFMHTIPRVTLLVERAEPGSPIDPRMIERYRQGAILARDLYGMLAGVPAPSVDANGEPSR